MPLGSRRTSAALPRVRAVVIDPQLAAHRELPHALARALGAVLLPSAMPKGSSARMLDKLSEVLAPGTGSIMKAPREPATRLSDPEPDLELDGESSPAVALEVVSLENDENLPTGMATLQVWMRGEDAFRVVCRASDATVGPLECDALERPRIALAEIAHNDGRDPGEILDLMWAWSQGVARLTRWLAQLRGTAICGS